MELANLSRICNEIFGVRGGDGSQEATGAVGHLKGYPINGNGEKTLFVSRQGGPSYGPVSTTKWKPQLVNLTWQGQVLQQIPTLVPAQPKLRAVDDCREGLVTHRKKSEWTGYHAEMIIVSRWLRLHFPSIGPGDLKKENVLTIRQKFHSTAGAMIAANAPCCKHCHNMLTALNIAHPPPATDLYGQPVLKASLTGWWNPLTDVRVPHADPDFGADIPGQR